MKRTLFWIIASIGLNMRNPIPLALSDRAATPQPYLETPEDWQANWAEGVSQPLKLPPEFISSGEPKEISEIAPGDFELKPKAKQRQLGREHGPLGADIPSLPDPPPAR